MDKVTADFHFLDLSDYARPIARRITRALINTPITPIQVTCAYAVVGFIAAALFATGTYLNAVIAGVLLLVKSTPSIEFCWRFWRLNSPRGRARPSTTITFTIAR